MHRSAAHCGVPALRRSRAGFWSRHNSSTPAKPRSLLAPGAALLQHSLDTWKAAHVPGPAFSQMWPWSSALGLAHFACSFLPNHCLLCDRILLITSHLRCLFSSRDVKYLFLHTPASCLFLKTRSGELHCCLLLLCF